LLSSAAVSVDDEDDEVEDEDEDKSRDENSFFSFNLCKELFDDELEFGEDEDIANKSLLFRVDIFAWFFDSLQQQFDEELHELVEEAVDEEVECFFCFMEFIEFFNFSFSNCKYLICSFCSFILFLR